MKISENMLKNWIEPVKNIDIITNQHISEVESFNHPFMVNNLVIGHVIECISHPNSDHLHVTKVDVKSEILDIVCGALNVDKGQYVIVAKEGAILPGDFVIKKSTIRGIQSNGMICSLKELGFEEKYIPEKYALGIYNFPENMEKYLGFDALQVLGLNGFVMELGLTPNRSDLLSVLGYAYDLAAVTKQKITLPKYKIEEYPEKNPVQITFDTNNCLVYNARYFRDVKIKESPWWMKSALILNDIRPINNVVDITNYVLLEYGTPLHTFDAKKVATKHIHVRNGKKGEKVVSLDGETRTLDDLDIVITNNEKPIAIGGVMGLENSVIDDNTTEVILEAACFNPENIRETSKRLNLKSDSSLRFEKGVDVNRVIMGLERATELLIELADAKVLSGIACKENIVLEPVKMDITKKYIEKFLGTKFNDDNLLDIFKALNYKVIQKDKVYNLTIPTYRNDIKIKEDVVEEIGRVYGYDNIKSKPLLTSSIGQLSLKQKRIRKMRHLLADFGLNEVISYTLIKDSHVKDFADMGEILKVMQPLSEDRNAVRQSLVNGLIETLNYNQARRNKNVFIYEIGNCYASNKESLKLGVLVSGSFLSQRLDNLEINNSFYLLKGVLANLGFALNVDFELKVDDNKIKSLYPNKQSSIYFNNNKIGFIGELSPVELQKYDVEKCDILEIELDDLVNVENKINYKPVTKYPSITRDLAFIVDDSISVGSIEQMLKQTTKKYLTNLEIFDIYKGHSIGEKKMSIAYSFTFNDDTKTLESSDVDKIMKSVINRLEFEFKASIRK